MKRVLTALVLIPLVLLAIFKAPFWLLTILVAAVALLAIDEYLRIVAGHNLDPLRVPTFVITAVFFANLLLPQLSRIPWFAGHPQVVQPLSQALTFLFLYCGPLVYLTIALKIKPLERALPSAAVGYLGIFYIVFALGRLLGIVEISGGSGPLLLVYGFVVVWSGDIAAYYTGRAIGKHLLAPNVSPKKTWEGAIASLVFSVALGSALLLKSQAVRQFFEKLHMVPPGWHSSVGLNLPFLQTFAHTNSWGWAIAASASINIAAQIGDLAESAMKRGANIKDSGTLLPGHGGVLDRIDALLFAAPVLWYYATSNLIRF